MIVQRLLIIVRQDTEKERAQKPYMGYTVDAINKRPRVNGSVTLQVSFQEKFQEEKRRVSRKLQDLQARIDVVEKCLQRRKRSHQLTVLK